MSKIFENHRARIAIYRMRFITIMSLDKATALSHCDSSASTAVELTQHLPPLALTALSFTFTF